MVIRKVWVKLKDLPDWMMRREKPSIVASLGRCGARYTVSIICAPRSVVPCTVQLLTTRMSIPRSSSNPARFRPGAFMGKRRMTWISAKVEIIG
jgi:hypothetical protein